MSQEDEEHIRGISGDSEKRDEEEEDYDSELDKEIDEELPRADLPTIVAPKLDAAQELFLAKDKDFYELLQDFEPVIPPEVTDYFMKTAGISGSTDTLRKIIALAVQRFASDIATESLHHCKFRQHILHSRDKSGRLREGKLGFTLEDLQQSVKEYGIYLTKPDYWADTAYESPAEKKAKAAAAAAAQAAASTSSLTVPGQPKQAAVPKAKRAKPQAKPLEKKTPEKPVKKKQRLPD